MMELATGTRKSYLREFAKIEEANGGSRMSATTRGAIRKKHNSLADTPRAADWMLQAVSILWNYAKLELDWPLGNNPAQNMKKFGPQRDFPTWPDWLLESLPDAPLRVIIAAELIRGTGQRPAAAIQTPRSAFQGEWVTVIDEKGDNSFPIYCPKRLRNVVEALEPGSSHVLARTPSEPVSYDMVEKEFRE